MTTSLSIAAYFAVEGAHKPYLRMKPAWIRDSPSVHRLPTFELIFARYFSTSGRSSFKAWASTTVLGNISNNVALYGLAATSSLKFRDPEGPVREGAISRILLDPT